MKKGFVFLSILLLLALAGFVPVKADDVAVVTPYIDTPTLTEQEIFDNSVTTWLVEYLRSGGTIDVGNSSDDYSVTDLIKDFGEFVVDVVGNAVDLINPFQTEFEWGNGYPLKKATPTIFQFMGMLPFRALESFDTPVPEPDPLYIGYINIINGDGFWWRNFTNKTLYENIPSLVYYPCDNVSWVSNSTFTANIIYNENIYCHCTNILTINIVTDGDGYSYSVSAPYLKQFIRYYNYPNDYVGYDYGYIITRTDRTGFQYLSDNNGSLTDTFHGSLEQIFERLAVKYRNININVDGVPWAMVNQDTSYNIQLSNDTVTPQGERVRWMYDKEIYIDIDKILERLEDILYEIQHTPDTPTIIRFNDFDDLIVDVDGQPALYVKVADDSRNIDEIYIENYGPIVPLFVPLFTPVINDSDILNIATTPMQAIPQDIIDVFAYIFIGGLFVCFIHRLLE